MRHRQSHSDLSTPVAIAAIDLKGAFCWWQTAGAILLSNLTLAGPRLPFCDRGDGNVATRPAFWDGGDGNLASNWGAVDAVAADPCGEFLKLFSSRW
jgi:hypothetical protein